MSPPVKTNIDFRLAIYETKLYRLLTNLEIKGVPLNQINIQHPQILFAMRTQDPIKYLTDLCQSHQNSTAQNFYCILCEHQNSPNSSNTH